MKIDTCYFGSPLQVTAATRAAREAGLDGFWITETGHDPFLSIALASQAEPELELGTGIAVAFARSPMTLAQTSWDLAGLTGGKFMLGLGSQVKAHITRRFSMPWGKPVEQMREMIAALRQIWQAFETGGKLHFEGEYYNLSLLTPFFTPAQHDFPNIPVGLAAVGPKMTELAGEVADFVVLHSFTNVRYLKDVTLPALMAGLEKSGRPRSALSINGSLFTVSTPKQEAQARKQVAFYGSTPAYSPVLEAIGHAELGTRLHQLSREGKWDEMGRLLPDDVFDQFVLRAQPDELKSAIAERFAGLYDRVTISMGEESGLPQ